MGSFFTQTKHLSSPSEPWLVLVSSAMCAGGLRTISVSFSSSACLILATIVFLKLSFFTMPDSCFEVDDGQGDCPFSKYFGFARGLYCGWSSTLSRSRSGSGRTLITVLVTIRLGTLVTFTGLTYII